MELSALLFLIQIALTSQDFFGYDQILQLLPPPTSMENAIGILTGSALDLETSLGGSADVVTILSVPGCQHDDFSISLCHL